MCDPKRTCRSNFAAAAWRLGGALFRACWLCLRLAQLWPSPPNPVPAWAAIQQLLLPRTAAPSVCREQHEGLLVQTGLLRYCSGGDL